MQTYKVTKLSAKKLICIALPHTTTWAEYIPLMAEALMHYDGILLQCTKYIIDKQKMISKIMFFFAEIYP